MYIACFQCWLNDFLILILIRYNRDGFITMKWKTTIYHTVGTILQSNRNILEKDKLYTSLSVICASFLWSVPIDEVKVDVLDHIWNLLSQFIIWHALTNAKGYVLWHYRARPMSVVASENNVTLFREVYCKMRFFAIKYSIKFKEKIY